MALEKTIVSEHGIDATYCNIGEIFNDFRQKVISVVVYGYANETVRRANKLPLISWKKQYTHDEALVKLNTTTPNIAQLYEDIKKLDDWFGAKDV